MKLLCLLKIIYIQVAFLHTRKKFTTQIHLTKPAKWILNQSGRGEGGGATIKGTHLLSGHYIAESPLLNQGHHLLDIEVCERDGRHCDLPATPPRKTVPKTEDQRAGKKDQTKVGLGGFFK